MCFGFKAGLRRDTTQFVYGEGGTQAPRCYPDNLNHMSWACRFLLASESGIRVWGIGLRMFVVASGLVLQATDLRSERLWEQS